MKKKSKKSKKQKSKTPKFSVEAKVVKGEGMFTGPCEFKVYRINGVNKYISKEEGNDDYAIFELTPIQYAKWFCQYYQDRTLDDMTYLMSVCAGLPQAPSCCDTCGNDVGFTTYLFSHDCNGGWYEPSRAMCAKCFKECFGDIKAKPINTIEVELDSDIAELKVPQKVYNLVRNSIKRGYENLSQAQIDKAEMHIEMLKQSAENVLEAKNYCHWKIDPNGLFESA